MAESANIARHLPLMAARQPEAIAIKIPRGRTAYGRIDYLALSFRELDAEVDHWVGHLRRKGVRPGDRVLVMVRQGLPLIAAAFALFQLGAVPVIIDPGMGRQNFLAGVARSRPRVLLGIAPAQLAGLVFRRHFATVAVRVWVRGSATARQSPNPAFRAPHSEMVASAATDLAAILFTSGSTGAPKGVRYEHGMFEAQVAMIREAYSIQPGEVDLPMLPIFALFNPALGMTTIVPEIDPSRPAAVDPAKIIQAIRQEGVTNSFGSPTLWRKIFDHARAHQIVLPTLRRVLCAGAPVPAALWINAAAVLTGGKLHSPYGATEALPVASVCSDEIGAGASTGALVGRPLPENRVKIVALVDGPIATLADARELPPGEIGEIIVTGPGVTKEYDHLSEATARAKIQNPDAQLPISSGGPLLPARSTAPPLPISALPRGDSAANAAAWHRMGDAGYLDRSGRLWFCGRVVERVETPTGILHTEIVEQVFRSAKRVARCALIGLGARGNQEAALVVQPTDGAVDLAGFARELRALAVGHPQTAGIRKFFFHADFPVDVRHNAKIHRLTLAQWAATAKAYEPEGAR